jgi:hypothetical protein
MPCPTRCGTNWSRNDAVAVLVVIFDRNDVTAYHAYRCCVDAEAVFIDNDVDLDVVERDAKQVTGILHVDSWFLPHALIRHR